MNKSPIYYTDGTGIFKVEKLIRAVLLTNLETKEVITKEIVGSDIKGFAIIDLSKVKDVLADTPKVAGAIQKSDKPRGPRKNKSSQYFGVSLSKQSGKWHTALWLDGKNKSVGRFDMEIEAAKAVDAELVKRGLPKRNFP
jgi:hypothetical protein